MNTKTNSTTLPRQFGFTESVNLEASLSEVWEVLADFDNVYTWAPGVSESHGIGEGHNQVGAGRHCKLSDFGAIDEYITEWKHFEHFTYTVSNLGPMTKGLSRWSILDIGQNRTKLTVEFAYDIRFSFFGKLMHSLVMKKKLRGSLPGTLEAFKQRVETGNLIRPLLKTA